MHAKELLIPCQDILRGHLKLLCKIHVSHCAFLFKIIVDTFIIVYTQQKGNAQVGV